MYAVFVDRQTLKYKGCRSQYIKNICTFRANLAIGKDVAKLANKYINGMVPPWRWEQWRWEVEEVIRRSV